MARPPASRADTHPTMRTPIAGRPYRSDPSKYNNKNDNNNNICTKRGDQHGPRTRTMPPPSGHNDNMDTCPVLKRTHGSEDRTPHRPGTTYTSTLDHPLLLTLATSEHACPHLPPNLALILAWTYGAVARALGSLVKFVPRLLLHLQAVPFTTRQLPVCTNQGKDKRSHALPQYTNYITTNTTQSAAVRRYYRERRHS